MHHVLPRRAASPGSILIYSYLYSISISIFTLMFTLGGEIVCTCTSIYTQYVYQYMYVYSMCVFIFTFIFTQSSFSHAHQISMRILPGSTLNRCGPDDTVPMWSKVTLQAGSILEPCTSHNTLQHPRREQGGHTGGHTGGGDADDKGAGDSGAGDSGGGQALARAVLVLAQHAALFLPPPRPRAAVDISLDDSPREGGGAPAAGAGWEGAAGSEGGGAASGEEGVCAVDMLDRYSYTLHMSDRKCACTLVLIFRTR